MLSPTTAQRAALADQLHAYADAIAAGTAPVPALRYQQAGDTELRVVPRLIHDVLCEVRIATPQTDTDPEVLHCAFCGLCYPRDTTPTPAAAATVSDQPSEGSKEVPA